MNKNHPESVLFSGEKSFPNLPVVDHYAGQEKFIVKALLLQQEMGAVFDITCDCEDGAKAGFERDQALMIAKIILSEENRFSRVAARIHDITHAHWQADLDILVGEAGECLPFITLPKARSFADVKTQIDYLRQRELKGGFKRQIPVHVLIETLGALKDVWQIAALDAVESLDFGVMDFVSAHHGAIASAAMKSPLQFEHPLLMRAKAEVSSAALANACVPTHNVTTELRDLAVIKNDAHRAKNEFAFLRMWSIHPNQIVPIIDAMRPDFSEVDTAANILIAAQNDNWAPIRFNEILHDRGSYSYFWQLLKRAKITGMDLPEKVITRFFADN